MARAVSSLQKGYWIGNIMTVASVSTSVNYFASIYPAAPYSPVQSLTFFSLSLGLYVGTLIARKGRRKTLLGADAIYLMLLCVLGVWNSPGVATVWAVLHDVLRGVCFITVFLYTKEFPPKSARGFCGTVYCTVYWLGYAIDGVLRYTVYSSDPATFPPSYYLYLKLGIGGVPLLLQLLLLLFLYRYEPPGYSFLAEDEAEATIAAVRFLPDPAERQAELEHFREESIFKKFRAVQWCDLFRQPYLRVMLIALAMHACRLVAGTYYGELVVQLLAHKAQRYLVSMILSCLRCVNLFIAIFLIDKSPVNVFLRIGFIATGLGSILMLPLLLLFVYAAVQEAWLIVGAALVSVPLDLLILPASYKFALVLLPDKGVATVSIFIFFTAQILLQAIHWVNEFYGHAGLTILLLVYLVLGVVASVLGLFVGCQFVPTRLDDMETMLKGYFVRKAKAKAQSTGDSVLETPSPLSPLNS